MNNFSSQHHSFDIHLAAEYGIEEAIIIHHFQHWIGVNMRKENGKKKNFHDGKWWTYQTLDDITAHFPYLSKNQVVTTIERLCNGKSRFEKTKKFEPVLIKGNFNKSGYDRTVWYAFADEEKFIGLCTSKKSVVDPQKENCGATTPIPDTKPDTKQDTTTTSVDKERESPQDESSGEDSSSFSLEDKKKIELLEELPINDQTKKNMLQFDIETIKTAIHNTKLKKHVQSFGACLFDQAKNGYEKGKTEEGLFEENKGEAAKVFKSFDMKKTPGEIQWECSLSNKYIEFSCGSIAKTFNYESHSFVQDVNRLMELSGSNLRV